MRKIHNWFLNGSLAASGILVALVIIEVALQFLPQFQSNARQNDLDLGEVQYVTGMGDLFHILPGMVAPPENPYEVLAEYEIAWDEDGFRVPAEPAESYDVLALGDSFTEAFNVATPWPDVLAAETNLAVRNLGYRGYGPIEQQHVMAEHGVESSADYVVIAFFEGNDLDNAESYSWRPEFRLPELTQQAFLEDFDWHNWTFEYDYDGPFRYPKTIAIDNSAHDAVFLEGYIWNLAYTAEEMAAKESVELTTQAWQNIRQMTDACVVIAYLPSKERMYLPYLQEDDFEQLFTFDAPDFTFDELLTRLPIQRDVIQEQAESFDFPFVDLSPAFRQATANGDLLYYTYDTHPNQAGHDLIGQTIAEFLTSAPCG